MSESWKAKRDNDGMTVIAKDEKGLPLPLFIPKGKEKELEIK